MEESAKTTYVEVVEIKQVGEGMRVCVDFIDSLQEEEGLYIGNTGHGYLKVLSENRQSEGYPPRPFRINCGGFHQYLYQEKASQYLQEIKSGESLTVSSPQGSRSISIGRVKIERRPFIRVTCQSDEGIIVSATLQSSTSVYVQEEEKGAVSVLDLKKRDRIAGRMDKPGRHLGKKIDEFIEER
ncbi:3-dehydroquinate synthase [Sediminibacillus dalangtanensis]|uniref:3-dehydroquinate synthase n=1 Tax=Sediminibacillus dalangtanensis TaxID=2729421 RepID=A0ABX7W1N4_9BACI|nr:3-dehydroquinate synthase II [Sediminibacillus dalangtanensis]QTN01083.1 3-dehydroquinate synthase [Sediminibacillus dalangtanensis]